MGSHEQQASDKRDTADKPKPLNIINTATNGTVIQDSGEQVKTAPQAEYRANGPSATVGRPMLET